MKGCKHNYLFLISMLYALLLVVLAVTHEIVFPVFMGIMAGLNLLWFLQIVWVKTESNTFAIIGFALLVRLICFWISPLFEDDHFRYLWDGYVVMQGENPYLLPPSAYFYQVLSPSMESVLNHVSYPDVLSVYGPGAQMLFAFSHWVSAGSVVPLKFMILLSELGIMLMLVKCSEPRILVLYAFCPLFLHGFAINAHFDVLAVFFAVLAYRSRTHYTAPVLLALSCSIKPFAIVLVPLLFTNVQSRLPFVDVRWKAIGIFGMAIFFMELPFILSGSSSFTNVFSASKEWAFNNPVFYFIAYLTTEGIARVCLLAAFILFFTYVWAFVREEDGGYKRAFYVLMCFIICSPVVNAWYLAWPLIFAAFAGFKGVWVIACVGWLSYFTGMHLSFVSGFVPGVSQLLLYQVPNTVLALEWGLPVLMYIYHRSMKNQAGVSFG